jgi:hypothetical protein
MTLTSLQALTWTTVTAAVVSALLLASAESRFSDWPRVRRAELSPHLAPADAAAGHRVKAERPAPLAETAVPYRDIAVR